MCNWDDNYADAYGADGYDIGEESDAAYTEWYDNHTAAECDNNCGDEEEYEWDDSETGDWLEADEDEEYEWDDSDWDE